jgi:hypothetical protein
MSSSDHGPDEDFNISDIAPYVLQVLRDHGYFDRLDSDFWPAHLLAPEPCDHTFRRTERILSQLDMESEDVEEAVLVLMSEGACCDCEVLYNVAEESRLKSRYWRRRALDIIDNSGR